MISNIGALRTLSYDMISAVSSGGRNYIPVKPSQFVYSQFKYISGFPAKNGQQGVSIDRLVILNTLIDQLVTMKQKSAETSRVDSGALSNDQIDALIEQYQGQIQTAAAVAETMDYKPLMPQTAMIVDLVA